MKRISKHRGLSLLITLVIMSVLLGISTSLLNVTLKQYLLSGIARDSEMAFQAAAAGIECAVFNDTQTNAGNGSFDVEPDGDPVSEPTISCFNVSDEHPVDSAIISGEEQLFRFTWGDPQVCTEISVFKYSLYNSAPGSLDMTAALQTTGSILCPESQLGNVPIECTVIQSRGYNVPCANLRTTRTVERELIQRY
jgi:hypothetical protein